MGNDDWVSELMPVASGEVIRNGILFYIKNSKSLMSELSDFFQTLEVLFYTLAEREICNVLVGGLVLVSYV
jgi:hypothetical protein